MGPIEEHIETVYREIVGSTAIMKRLTERKAEQIISELIAEGATDDPVARKAALARHFGTGSVALSADDSEITDLLLAYAAATKSVFLVIGEALDRLLEPKPG